MKHSGGTVENLLFRVAYSTGTIEMLDNFHNAHVSQNSFFPAADFSLPKLAPELQTMIAPPANDVLNTIELLADPCNYELRKICSYALRSVGTKPCNHIAMCYDCYEERTIPPTKGVCPICDIEIISIEIFSLY